MPLGYSRYSLPGTTLLADRGDDLGALLWRRQGTDAGGEVVDEVLELAGGGDHAGDGRIGQHELEEHLRPALRAELRRPRRQRLALHLREQVAILERDRKST